MFYSGLIDFTLACDRAGGVQVASAAMVFVVKLTPLSRVIVPHLLFAHHLVGCMFFPWSIDCMLI